MKIIPSHTLLSLLSASALTLSLGATPPITTNLVVHLNDDVTLNVDNRVLSWNDSSGQGNDAVLNPSANSPLFVAGATPGGTGAVRFNSVNSELLQIAGNPGLFDTTAITIFTVLSRSGDGSDDQSRVINFAFDEIGNGTNYGALDIINRRNAGVRTIGRSNTGGFQGASSSSGATVANSFNVVGGSWDGSSEFGYFLDRCYRDFRECFCNWC